MSQREFLDSIFKLVRYEEYLEIHLRWTLSYQTVFYENFEGQRSQRESQSKCLSLKLGHNRKLGVAENTPLFEIIERSYPKGEYKEDRPCSFPFGCGKTRSNGHKPKHRRFPLYRKKHLFSLKGPSTGTGFPERWWSLQPWVYSKAI